jgi:hypothetical protein
MLQRGPLVGAPGGATAGTGNKVQAPAGRPGADTSGPAGSAQPHRGAIAAGDGIRGTVRAAAAGEPTGKFCATEVMSGIDGMAAAHRRRASDSSQRSGTKREERGRLPYVILAAAIRCGPACSPNPYASSPRSRVR